MGDNLGRRPAMKKILLTAMAILTGLALIGCGIAKKGETTIETEEQPSATVAAGDYYAFTCKDSKGTKLELDGEVLHINSDGTGSFKYLNETYSLEWTYENGEFTFTDEGGDTFNGKCYDTIIAGTYFNDYYYEFTSDKELAQAMIDGKDTGSHPAADPQLETADSTAVYYTMQNLYEPKYGIKTALALVPYGWTASVNVDWGRLSTKYPAVATISLVSPDGDAAIEIMSTDGYLQMARNGVWMNEGAYLDMYNVFLNYRNAHDYNAWVLNAIGRSGTVINQQGPSYEFQLDLNGAANAYLATFTASGQEGVQCEGTYEKTSYLINDGELYAADLSSTVIMAETLNGAFDSYSWFVPYLAIFTAATEDAYNNYSKVFDNVVANSSFSNEFRYVVQKNAEYLNEMMRQYLLEKIYSPSSGDIESWDSSYTETESDKLINAWSDVIMERDEYTTLDGNSIKVSTQYDTVYQDGDLIYMGPDSQSPEGWTKLDKVDYSD